MTAENANQKCYDLCIVGSGPAGIILALEYSSLNPDKEVILIEYGAKGGLKENQLDNSIQNNNPVNHYDPYACTNKGLGGTSATWGGRCVMYDKADFISRPILGEDCTWDVGLFTEVQNYLSRSADYFECGKPVFNLNDLSGHSQNRIAQRFREGDVIDSALERWSMPTRFGKRYAKEISSRPNLTVLFEFEARDFIAPSTEGDVPALLIRQINTKISKQVFAKTFVLAAGTQETTRILLRNSQLFRNLPTVPPALGKYYQGHVSGKIASIQFKGHPQKTDFAFIRDVDGTYLRRRFQFSTEFLVKNNLLNTAMWLDNPLYFDPNHKSGSMSFIYLAMLMPVLGRKLAPPAIAHSVTKGKAQEVGRHLYNIVKDLPGSLTKPVAIFFRRYCLKRKLPGVFFYSPDNYYALHFHAEQKPVASNCMVLAGDGETLIINYSLTDDDVNSIIKTHQALDEWLRENDCGQLEYWYAPEELPKAIRSISKDGIHQLGTTRIADSPDKGVVDRDLKLWGTNNVFVCSSSVFPTSGQANPTFFLGAFAVRLANHLTKAFSES